MQRMGEKSVKPIVYFDGGCPVCRREIGAYQRAPGGAEFNWVDVNSCPPAQLGADLDKTSALARLHVRQSDGRLRVGVDAFVAIWEGLPNWRWLARLAKLPGMLQLLRGLYASFLWLRPLWRK